jgi:pimeloyl-ACP methyl ester carboxylesterase
LINLMHDGAFMLINLDQRFHFDGAAVAWTSFGEGLPMVLIHGTPFSAQVWRRIAPHLARVRRVFLFDLLGYGDSAKGPGLDVSLGVQDRLLAALVEHWGLDRPDVLAHDFGGATALRGWLLQGVRYRTLTLIDPVAIAPWGSPFVAHVRAHEAAFAGLPDYAHRALLEAYVQGAVARPMRDADLAVHRAPWVGPVGQAAFYAQIAQMDQAFTDVIEPRLGEVDCPRALLWGAEDAWIPLAQGGRLAARMGTGLDVIPGAGHLVQEDAPEAILSAAFAMLGQG